MDSLRRLLFCCGVMAAAFFAISGQPAHAVSGSAPVQLHGKSVSIRWSEDIEGKRVTGETGHRVINQAIGIYVSTQGRVFSRGSRAQAMMRGNHVGRGTSVARSTGPSGDVIKTSNSKYSSNFHFEGRAIVGTMALESGARRTVINFDEGFRTCTVDVTYGKEAGAPGLVAHGLDTRLYLVVSMKVSGQSCTIADGNIFGEGD